MILKTSLSKIDPATPAGPFLFPFLAGPDADVIKALPDEAVHPFLDDVQVRLVHHLQFVVQSVSLTLGLILFHGRSPLCIFC